MQPVGAGEQMTETFAGRRVTVMGLGTFGGGIAATRFLAERGAEVTVTDLRPAAQLAGSLNALDDLSSVRFHFGGHDEADFTNSDLIVASPAVKPENRFLSLARQAHIPITSELRLFWERCGGRIIGVTGSNGKSTTATLIHDMLKADGRCVWLGGNIGRSLLPDLDDVRPDDWVVLELSSFQLADLNTARLSPHVAVVTNLTPNHLDWHGTFEEYAAAKETIVRWQTIDDIAVRQIDTLEADWPTRAAQWWFGGENSDPCHVRMNADWMSIVLPGNETVELRDCPGLAHRHDRTNALAATAAAVSIGARPDAIVSALLSFRGLPHRLEQVRDWQGRRFVNDSASTTPESTVMALTAHKDADVVLIAGGAEKGCETAALASAIAAQARIAVLFGAVAPKLIGEIDRTASSLRGQAHPVRLETVMQCPSLESALNEAVRASQPGETILFSPGFSSGTMFTNYDARGRAFVELVRLLPEDVEN